jgi:hypothetical protein
MGLRSLHYDDDLAALRGTSRSLFLAGPTQRSRTSAPLTPWRARALLLLEHAGFDGAAVIPEFRAGDFDVKAPLRFGEPASAAPSIRATTFNASTALAGRWRRCRSSSANRQSTAARHLEAQGGVEPNVTGRSKVISRVSVLTT